MLMSYLTLIIFQWLLDFVRYWISQSINQSINHCIDTVAVHITFGWKIWPGSVMNVRREIIRGFKSFSEGFFFWKKSWCAHRSRQCGVAVIFLLNNLGLNRCGNLMRMSLLLPLNQKDRTLDSTGKKWFEKKLILKWNYSEHQEQMMFEIRWLCTAQPP